MDASLKVVQESIESQRLSIADSGLHLLWCLLDRQPENMPLLLTHSWVSCYHLLHQALQHENNSIFISSLQVTSAFLRPQHQQSHVDIQAITTLVCISASKSQDLLNKHQTQPGSSALGDENEFQLSSVVLNALMDIISHTSCLFQTGSIFPGNDKQHLSELKHLVQSIATDIVVSKNVNPFLKDPAAVEKYLRCANTSLFIQLYDSENQARGQQTTSLLTLENRLSELLKNGVPWLILRAVGNFRCPLLENEAIKLIVYILSSCMKSLLSALHLDCDILALGLTQLQWTEAGLSLDQVPTQKEAVIVKLTLLYFSYFHVFRPWSLEKVCCFLYQVFDQHSSFLSWHLLVLKSTVYLLAISENSLEVEDSNIADMQCCVSGIESSILTELHKTSVEMWYTDCVEILMWTLSSHTKTSLIGRKTIEYWLHQRTLFDKLGEEMDDSLQYLKCNFPFFHCIIDLLDSNTVGEMARSLLIRAFDMDEQNASQENITGRLHEKLIQAFSKTPNIDETSVANILPALCVLLDKDPTTESHTSCLNSVKLITHCAKYMSRQDSDNFKLMNPLKYLSTLVKQLTLQESKIVIPPLLQNTRFVSLLKSKLTDSNPSIVSHVLVLCAWLANHGTFYQASSPLTITSNFLLSSLASCRLLDVGAILQLIKSALLTTAGQKEPVEVAVAGAVAFVRSHRGFLSYQHIFRDTEIHQIFCYMQQYLVISQSNLPTTKLAQDILWIVLNRPGVQLVSNPWNSVLLENIPTIRDNSCLSPDDLQLCSMLSAQDDIWTVTSSNSFLLALTCSDLDAKDIKAAKNIITSLKQRIDLVDSVLLEKAEKHISTQI